MADREIRRGRERLTLRRSLGRVEGLGIDGPEGPKYSGTQLVLVLDVTAVVAVIEQGTGLPTFRRVMAVTMVHSSTVEVAGQPSPARAVPPAPQRLD